MPRSTLLLSPSDWIYLGPGRLYGPPFVSRFLLYRLHDADCCLLVSHEATVGSAFHNQQGLSVCEARVHEPTVAYVRFATAVNASWVELSGLAPETVPLQEARNSTQKLGPITVRIHPQGLDLEKMHDLAAGEGGIYPIGKTEYSVMSPASLFNIGKAVFSGCDQFSKFRCWRVSVAMERGNRKYDLQSDRHWTLTAAQLGDAWEPKLELHVDKGRTKAGSREA